jgi:N utilization substance protein B
VHSVVKKTSFRILKNPKNPEPIVIQRRKARTLVVEALYRFDLVGDPPLKTILDIIRRHRLNEEAKRYARQLLDSVVTNLTAIDGSITKTLRGWDFNRLSTIDRAILRLATCELLFLPQIPPKVCINEAVELTRGYSTEGSTKFVNAVLDKIMKTGKENTTQKSK